MGVSYDSRSIGSYCQEVTRARSSSCCDLSTASSEDTVQMAQVKAIARQLANDIIRYITESPTPSPSCSHARTLRRIVDGMSTRYQIVFESIVKKLGVRSSTKRTDKVACRRTFYAVTDELFADGQRNWGRVATVFAFAAWLAKHPYGQNSDNGVDDIAEAVAEAAGDYVADNLSAWILAQGGWDAMETFFKDHQFFETAMWRGLWVTLFALGTMAVIASLTR